MTREEAEEYAKEMTYRDAINNLMKARSIPYRKATFIKVNELLKTLEQKPCENAISRQAVMDALCNDCELFRNGEQTCFTKCEEYHFLATLPPADSQSKIGHWILGICDNCEYDWNKDALIASVPNFCPNCGAKMIKKQGERSE